MSRCLLLTVWVVLSIGGLGFAKANDDSADDTVGGPVWRFEFANDVVFGSDNQFTNGFTIQRHSPLFESLGAIRGLPFGRWLAKRILPDREELFYRNGFTIGHNMQTPDDIEDPNIILNDVPYLGMLGAGNTWIAFDDSRFTGFEVLFGLVGEESGADELQEWVHEVIDSEDPLGWENQLDTEPILNFYYMRKRKVWNRPGFDGALGVDLGAGNFWTGAEVALEMRFGKMPEGFTHVPSPLGVALHYDAILPDDRPTLVYGSFVIRGTGHGLLMARDGNILVDGNEWTDDNVLDPKKFVAAAIAGFHLVRPTWGLHFNWWFTSDTVDDAGFAAPDDPSNDFGTFVIEWRF